MVLIRLAKVAMIASLAAYAFIVAYDNIVDYQSNYEFVRHVLSMDTTFHGNALMHRAISNERIWSLAYALIIAMEGARDSDTTNFDPGEGDVNVISAINRETGRVAVVGYSLGANQLGWIGQHITLPAR
jgi:hypothetical protein